MAEPLLAERMHAVTDAVNLLASEESRDRSGQYQRQEKRRRQIRELKSTDPKKAELVLEDVLGDIEVHAHSGDSNLWYGGRQGGDPAFIRDKLVAKLTEHGLNVDVYCGHGHGFETVSDQRCDGKMYSTCWLEVKISW